MGAKPSIPDDAESLRNTLVNDLVRRGVITTQAVERAFRAVPRHLFVPRVDTSTAYSDQPIFLRWEGETPTSSSSQPTIMAIMAEQLRLEPGMRVLEIGTGSGYNAAILAHLVEGDGHVVTIDIDSTLVDDARENLSAAGYGSVEVVCGDGSRGFNDEAPYDRIIVTANAHDVSSHWVDQLSYGGVLVAPLWFKGYSLSVALGKRAKELTGLSVSPCIFMPLRGDWQRTEGYYPIQGPSEQPLPMSIGLDWREQVDLAKLYNILASDKVELIDIGRSLEGHFISQNLLSGLFLFLTIHAGIFVFLPTGQDAPFQTPGYGLIDKDLNSAAILNDGFPSQALTYGTNSAHSELLEILNLWDGLGRPTLSDLKVQALLESPMSIPHRSWIIPKKSDYTWLLSWDI